MVSVGLGEGEGRGGADVTERTPRPRRGQMITESLNVPGIAMAWAL